MWEVSWVFGQGLMCSHTPSLDNSALYCCRCAQEYALDFFLVGTFTGRHAKNMAEYAEHLLIGRIAAAGGWQLNANVSNWAGERIPGPAPARHCVAVTILPSPEVLANAYGLTVAQKKRVWGVDGMRTWGTNAAGAVTELHLAF
jgi:hypothetical protein